jgi:hypothetical protein
MFRLRPNPGMFTGQFLAGGDVDLLELISAIPAA